MITHIRVPRLNLYHIIIFYYAASEKSLTSAAEKLCLSQPAVTRHIKALENSLNLKLFEVNRRKIVLTPAGVGLFAYARAIYNNSLATERFLVMTKESKDSEYNIGVSAIFVSAISDTLKKMYLNRRSLMKLNISIQDSLTLMQSLYNSKIDLAIIPRIDTEFVSDKLIHTKISEVKLVFYSSPDHPIFKNDPINWQDICTYPIITGPDITSLPKIISNKLAAQGITTPPIFGITANSIEICKTFVQDGNSISVALWGDIKNDVREGRVRVIDFPNSFWVEVDAVTDRGLLDTSIIQDTISLTEVAFNHLLKNR